MKFLHLYCEKRKANVYISLDKIVLVSSGNDMAIIEVQGAEPVHVNQSAEELVRMINGENKTSIGFRAGR